MPQEKTQMSTPRPELQLKSGPMSTAQIMALKVTRYPSADTPSANSDEATMKEARNFIGVTPPDYHDNTSSPTACDTSIVDLGSSLSEEETPSTAAVDPSEAIEPEEIIGECRRDDDVFASHNSKAYQEPRFLWRVDEDGIRDWGLFADQSILDQWERTGEFTIVTTRTGIFRIVDRAYARKHQHQFIDRLAEDARAAK